MNSVVVKDQYQLSQWAALIKECNESGIKKSEWLRLKGITRDQYYYWRRKVQDRSIEAVSASFVEVPVSSQEMVSKADQCSDISAEIRLGNISFMIRDSASPEFLKKLIKAAADA